MQFQQWLVSMEDTLTWAFNEATLNTLYQSTVAAFPETTKRQFVTDSIKIVELSWTPYLGVRTLFIKGRAVNEGRHYKPIILFKNVQYHETKDHPEIVELMIEKKYYLEKLQYSKNDVLVRCDCPDFKYRFADYNDKEKTLYGSKPKYEAQGIVNPLELPGMCKHLLKMIDTLTHSGIMED